MRAAPAITVPPFPALPPHLVHCSGPAASSPSASQWRQHSALWTLRWPAVPQSLPGPSSFACRCSPAAGRCGATRECLLWSCSELDFVVGCTVSKVYWLAQRLMQPCGAPSAAACCACCIVSVWHTSSPAGSFEQLCSSAPHATRASYSPLPACHAGSAARRCAASRSLAEGSCRKQLPPERMLGPSHCAARAAARTTCKSARGASLFGECFCGLFSVWG